MSTNPSPDSFGKALPGNVTQRARQSIRLHFVMKDADLYSFPFTTTD